MDAKPRGSRKRQRLNFEFLRTPLFETAFTSCSRSAPRVIIRWMTERSRGG